jgi:hypothetical protein
MPKQPSSTVLGPNLGLYFDRPSLAIPLSGLQAGNNFRIKNGKLSSLNLGWTRFSDFTLNGPVVLIDNFFLRNGAQRLIFATLTDLYLYSELGDDVSFITPQYTTGTVDVSNANPAVVSAASGSPTWDASGIKEGDQITFGTAGETDPAATWYTIDSVDSDTQLTLTAAVAGSPLTGQDYTIRRLLSGEVDNSFDTATFFNAYDTVSMVTEDRWYCTNGVDPIIRWNGTDTAATYLEIADLGFTCKNLTVYQNMLIYGHILDSSGEALTTTIINSNPGEPENVSSGLSEQFVTHSGVDPINALLQLGDNLVIYAQRTAVLCQFVGDPLVLAFRVAISGIGPVNGKLIADFGDFHEFLGPDTQYRFDGVTLQEQGFQIWREVLRIRDPNRIALAFSHFDEENGDLIWAIPLTTDGGDETTGPQEAYVEHYLEEVGDKDPVPFSHRDFPFTSEGFFERLSTLTWADLTDQWQNLNFTWNDQFFFAAFPFNLVGDADGKVYTLNTSQTGAGAALPSYVTFGRRAIGDGKMRGLLTRIYPFAKPFDGEELEIYVYLSDHASGDATISDLYTFDLSLAEGGHFVSIFRASRFAAARFGRSDGGGWELEGYDVDVRPGGYR